MILLDKRTGVYFIGAPAFTHDVILYNLRKINTPNVNSVYPHRCLVQRSDIMEHFETIEPDIMVGEKVIVVPPINLMEDRIQFVPSMQKYIGRIMFVAGYMASSHSYGYVLSERHHGPELYAWHPSWVETMSGIEKMRVSVQHINDILMA